MTELVPDPSPRRPRRINWPALSLLLLLGVAVVYIVYLQRKPAQVVIETRPPEPVTAPEQPAAAEPQEAEVAPPVPENKPQAAVVPEPPPREAPPAPSPTAPAQAGTDLAEAESLLREGRLQAARVKARAVLEQAAGDPTRQAQAEQLLGTIHTELLFYARPMPEKSDYTVQVGDSLDKIARQYGTTVELIQRSNNIKGPVIKAGQRLRVFSGTWSIRVNKTRNDLVLTLNGDFFKRYRVGTGEFSKTPVGEFRIVERLSQPTWWHPDGRTIPFGDPENLLGTHWLALDIKGYGIHGTWEPETVGKQSSMGCIRLRNEEVEELYTLVTNGTPVVIEE